MRVAGLALALLTLLCSVEAGSWTQSSLARYLRLRRGRRGACCWRGTGTLRNTVNGELISAVESVELARPLRSPGSVYSSKRLILYRHANGTLLTAFKNRRVPPLRYEHHVRVSLEEGGGLRLEAREPGGREVASALADGGGPVRSGLLGRAYDLFVRVPVGQSEKAKAARRKKKAAIGSREEYRLTEAGPLGLRSALSYRRTGRCPSWYGPGTCTLELHSRRQWSWALWRRGEPPACWRRCEAEADAAAATGAPSG